jgi:hypothetical protein
MKPGEWKTYRTRFLVKAKQLSSSLSFVDPLGRQHCGRKGDYLVESSDGVISIAPRQIFEDIYVPIVLENALENELENANSRLLPSQASAEAMRGEMQSGPIQPEAVPGRRKRPQSSARGAGSIPAWG